MIISRLSGNIFYMEYLSCKTELDVHTKLISVGCVPDIFYKGFVGNKQMIEEWNRAF